MITFNKILLISLITISANATSLKEIINSTIENNENLQSLKIQNNALNKTYHSVKNIYNPSINIGANYLKLDGDVRNVQIGQTTTAYAKLSIDLYNGGKNTALKKQKEYEYKSGLNNELSNTRQTILQVVTMYFNTKTILENIKVLNEKAIALKAQYDRVKTKYDLRMTTIDEVYKFKSEYEENQYQIDELKYQKEVQLQNLSLVSNLDIKSLDDVVLPNTNNLEYSKSTTIKSLEYQIKAQEKSKDILNASNMPQIKLQDTYNIYNYDDYNSQALNDLPEQQNQLMISLNFKLFDTSTNSKIQSATLAKNSTIKKLEYLKKQEEMNFKLSKKRLVTNKLKINSSKSALKMANSVYKTVKVKYENGVVDNIVYLDALRGKIYNQAMYKQSLNDYEIAKANYYFNSGKNYKEVLSTWK